MTFGLPVFGVLPRRAAGAAAVLALALAIGGASPASAQQILDLTQGGGEQMSIQSAGALEWHQEEKLFVASGGAVVTRGDVTISADQMQAAYRDGPDGAMDIYRFEAHGGVVIERGEERITGANAVYDVDAGVFTMTGGNLSLTDGQSTITATRSLEYREKALTATAIGDVHIKKEDENLYADRVDAKFTGNSSGGQPELSYAEASGGVRIVTATEVITGNSGTYDLSTKIATLTGDVKLTRGQNQLNGQYAEVNMATGISRLTGSPEGGRVEGLLVPSDGGEPGGGDVPVLPTLPSEGQ